MRLPNMHPFNAHAVMDISRAIHNAVDSRFVGGGLSGSSLMIAFLRRLPFMMLLLIVPASCCEASYYQQQETPHFIIHHHQADAKLSSHMAAVSEKLREKIIADVGYAPAEKTHIVLAPTLEDFQKAQPGRQQVPLWAAAVAYPGLNLMILRSPRAVKGGRLDYHTVFIHEYTHIVLGRALQHRDVPRFLAEGIAMYVSSEWHFSRMAVLTKAALTDRIIPLQQLTHGFPDDLAAAELAYAQSFMFISFLIDRFGGSSFQQFIRDYSQSGDLKHSLLKMTGMDLFSLEKEWIAYVKRRVSWIPLITSATTLWFLATLVFIYGYYRKKRRTAAMLKMWEEQEKLEYPAGTIRRE
jgi:hypothetical protein